MSLALGNLSSMGCCAFGHVLQFYPHVRIGVEGVTFKFKINPPRVTHNFKRH